MIYEEYDAYDMYKDVCFFNLTAKGTEPVYSPIAQETFDRLESQLKLILEEVSEAAAAIKDKDKPEILKEVLDIGVVWMGMLQILENAGYDVWPAAYVVCENNNSKIMSNIEDAVESVEKHFADGVKAYTDTTKVGETEYFSVRRMTDGKILKPYFFRKVDMSDYVPRVH